jgi:CheY-like chemotaxis protein
MAVERQTVSIPTVPVFGTPKWVLSGAGLPSDEAGHVARSKQVKIVVVDDEPVIAETVVEILKEEGFHAVSVSNGAAAIELAKTLLPDIILSDVIMPGMNGIETAIRIREIVPACKIILFSGQAATVDLLENARRQGHRFEVLAKPISPDHLISVVRTTSGHFS